MSDTTSRGITNLATRRVDPKRMLARNRQTEETPVDEPAEVEPAGVEPTPVAEVAAPPAPAPSQPKSPRRSAAASVEEDEAGYMEAEDDLPEPPPVPEKTRSRRPPRASARGCASATAYTRTVVSPTGCTFAARRL